jgi:hypothetical protein
MIVIPVLSPAFTSFHVDHKGELLEGHDYLLILPTSAAVHATDVFLDK